MIDIIELILASLAGGFMGLLIAYLIIAYRKGV